MREPERLEPVDLMTMSAQPSQMNLLGIDTSPDWEQAAQLAAQPVAWCARRDDGSILACFGINETFEGVQGVAWALLSSPIGKDHFALTRFVRSVVANSGLRRVELFAKCADIESTRSFFLERGAPVDSGVMVSIAMSEPTPECRWAVMLGFTPAHVCRRFGFDGSPLMLLEWFGEGR